MESGINANEWRTVYSPRMRCAVRSSLPQAGKRVKKDLKTFSFTNEIAPSHLLLNLFALVTANLLIRFIKKIAKCNSLI
jgi:hypothetical protein